MNENEGKHLLRNDDDQVQAMDSNSAHHRYE